MPKLRTKKRIINAAARKYGIEPDILWGLYGAETNFGKNVAVSRAGAQGDFQFMPGTARSMGVDPHSFRSSAYGAAKYLSQYKDRGTKGMLAAYNAGPAGNPNNPETAAYVPKVLDLAKTWQGPRRSSPSTAASPSPSSSTSVSYRPGQDRSADRRALMGQYLLNSHDPNALLNLATGLRGAQDTPGSFKYQTKYQATAATAVEAGGQVDQYKAAADLLDAAKLPYKWGGGHQKNLKLAKGGKPVPVDCSGAVSAVLGIDPRVAAQFQGWGKSGRGKRVTIYAAKDGSHVLMEINGHFFGTSRTNPGGGAGWIPRSKLSKQYLSRFVARHPAGL